MIGEYHGLSVGLQAGVRTESGSDRIKGHSFESLDPVATAPGSDI